VQSRKVDVRLPGKGDSYSHGARPVHLMITMVKWIRTSRLSMNYLSEGSEGCLSRDTWQRRRGGRQCSRHDWQWLQFQGAKRGAACSVSLSLSLSHTHTHTQTHIPISLFEGAEACLSTDTWQRRRGGLQRSRCVAACSDRFAPERQTASELDPTT